MTNWPPPDAPTVKFTSTLTVADGIKFGIGLAIAFLVIVPVAYIAFFMVVASLGLALS